MQSTGQTVMHASQPVHMSSSSNASTLGSFFLAIKRPPIVGRRLQETSGGWRGYCTHPPHCARAAGQLSTSPAGSPMEYLKSLIDIFLHLDRHLNDLAGNLGGWMYALLFLIIFAETGLVITPF